MKAKYLLYIIFSGMLCAGCDDFLDESPRGNAIAETTEEYEKLFNDSQGFNMYLAEQYYALWKSDDLIFTDDCYNTIAMASSFPTSIQAAIEYKDKIYRDDETTPEWERITQMLYSYNVIANGVPTAKGSDADKKHLLAEARVCRAYMHFLLAQWYAMPYNENTAATEKAIPIVTKADTQIMYYERATVKELYEWIITEMEEACPDLKERTEHRMRCYKSTGYALLGKVYFHMSQYNKALVALRQAYDALQGDSNVYLTDHRTKQAEYGYTEIPMMPLSSYIPYPYKDNEVLFCKCGMGGRQYYPLYYSMQPSDFLKPEVYALFNENDLRRNLICTKDINGKAYPYPTATFIGAMTNIGCTLPEVYLMLAECEARAGSESNARAILKTFRTTRLLPGYEEIPATVSTKNDLIRFCVEEQTREFAGTGYRFYNVRRLWNDPLFQDWKPITHTVGDKVFTMQEFQLKTQFPETVLIWNENWRE